MSLNVDAMKYAELILVILVVLFLVSSIIINIIDRVRKSGNHVCSQHGELTTKFAVIESKLDAILKSLDSQKENDKEIYDRIRELENKVSRLEAMK